MIGIFMAISSKQQSQPVSRLALWNLVFRPFFLFAGIFAVLSMGMWMFIYVFNLPYATTGISVYQWHAHEMIYGYSMAVIAASC